MISRPWSLALLLALGSSCAAVQTPRQGGPASSSVAGQGACGGRPQLQVTFFDVGQGLSALVTLPGGQHVLVDTGESPDRPGCGSPCRSAHQHLIAGIRDHLGEAPIDILWLTHGHSDHTGGASSVLRTFRVGSIVLGERNPLASGTSYLRREAERLGVPVRILGLGAAPPPLPGLAAVMPRAWPSTCRRDENQCSLGLRVQSGDSSVLFVGDAGADEERQVQGDLRSTLLQVVKSPSLCKSYFA